jgi:hypothetical protein
MERRCVVQRNDEAMSEPESKKSLEVGDRSVDIRA